MEEVPCHCKPTNKECNTFISAKSSETSLSKKSIKGRHTLLKSEHSCNCYATHNEDVISYYMRQLQEVEQSLCNKNLMIAMLQEQLKKFEKLYKKNLDETQNIRYKYCYASRELSNLKKIFQKYEEENKLSDDNKNDQNYYSEKEIEELQNEANKWKQLYEEVLNKIKLMEDDMIKMKELLATKEEALSETDTRIKTEIVPVSKVPCNDLKEQYENIENALVIQNEKLDMIYKILSSDLKKQSGEIQNILSATQGDIIEISIEAKKLRKVTASLQEISVEKLWSENTALKNEIDKIKSTSASNVDKQKACCSITSYNLLLNELNMCRNDMKVLEKERDELKRRLEVVAEENTKLNENLDSQDQRSYSCSNSCTQTETKKIESIHTITEITGDDQENKIKELQKENGKLRDEIERLLEENKEIAFQENKLREVTSLYADLEVRHAELLEKSKNTDEQLENLLSQSKKKEEENENLKEEIEELEKQLQQSIVKSNKSLVIVNEYENKIIDLEDALNRWKTKCNELHEKVTVLEENEYKFKKELTTLETNLDQANNSLEKYEGQLKNKEDELDKLVKLSQDLELTIQNLNESHEKSEQKLRDEGEKNKLALAEVVAEYEKLKATLNNYEGITSKKIEELLKELEKLTAEAAVLKDLVADLTSQICQRHSETKFDNGKIVSLEEECSVLKEKNRLLEKEVQGKAELEALLTAVENKLTLAEKEIKRKDTELQEKSDDLKALEEEHDRHMEKVKELDFLVQELTDENENLKTNLDNLVKSLESKINEVNLCNDFKECQCSSSLEIELQHKATQTVKTQAIEKATGCVNFPDNVSSKIQRPTYSFLPCTSYYRKPREFESEELEIKRRYLINRILSIDAKLNVLQESAVRVTSSKSLPHISPYCSCISKQSEQKKTASESGSNQKKEGILTLFAKRAKRDVDKPKKPENSSCSCSSTDLQNFDDDRWSKNSKIVASMRRELEEASCSLAKNNVESTSNCVCLAERVVDLQDQIYTTLKIEHEVELLEKHLHRQRNQVLTPASSHIPTSRPCVNTDCLQELEKREAILREINQIGKKLKKKREEEQLLQSQCKKLADELQKAEVVKEKSDDDSSNAVDTDDSFPQQPLIKIKCTKTEDAGCSKFPSPLLISTCVEKCKKYSKKHKPT